MNFWNSSTVRLRGCFRRLVAPLTATSSIGFRCMGTSPCHTAKSHRMLSTPRMCALLFGASARDSNQSSTGRACKPESAQYAPLRQNVISQPNLIGTSGVQAFRHLLSPIVFDQRVDSRAAGAHRLLVVQRTLERFRYAPGTSFCGILPDGTDFL